MAWTAPVTRATGYVVLAADWNAEHVANLQYLHGDAGAFSLANGFTAAGNIAASPGTLAATSNITTSGGVIGYTPGTGATVTQITSRNTAVTINSISGAITTSGANLTAGSQASFTVNNSFVLPGYLVAVHANNNPVTGTALSPIVIGVGSGLFVLAYTNTTAATVAQVLIITFAVFAAATT